MSRIRILVVGAAAAMTIAGVGIATAGSTVQAPSLAKVSTAQVLQQINAAEAKAAAACNIQAVTALQQAEAAIQARQAKGGGDPKGNGGNPPPCPSSAPNAGNPQA